MKDLIERLRLIYEDDHERGCDGRCYACSCGYDEANEATARQAAEALSAQAAREEAARLEGIRLGLEAAAEAAMCYRAWVNYTGDTFPDEPRTTILSLDPSTILRDKPNTPPQA